MSHKVHPKAFRIRRITDWDARWLETKKFPQYLEEDFKIREFLRKKLGRLGIERIEIERFSGKLNIIISSARPGLIIGRGGGGVEDLKKELEKVLIKGKPSSTKVTEGKREIKLEIREIKDPWLSAELAAQWIAQQIEKRTPFRRVLKQALAKITGHKEAQGARVEVAGRLDGKQIARTEWLKKGRLPRQTIRADIDYAQARALCTYGIIGIKVWIYKGEKFE
jgi:small subunit ribosomal protein S3